MGSLYITNELSELLQPKDTQALEQSILKPTFLQKDDAGLDLVQLLKPSSFLLGCGFTLTFHCPLGIPSDELLTLFFHTLQDAIAFIKNHQTAHEEIPQTIQNYGKLLAEGKLVAFPTETVYGLGADATNEHAVARIFEAKQRPFFDPLIVHIASLDQLDGLVSEIPQSAYRLMETFWPGPLTLVMKKHPSVADIVTAKSATVAVRMPSNPLALALIKASGRPIAAPSANRFGYTSPTTAEHVYQQLSGRIDAVLDGGACTVGIESTVLSLYTDVPTILRPGKIGVEELKPILGDVKVAQTTGPTDTHLESPGLLENHYAPKTPLYLVEDVAEYKDRSDVGVLLFEQTDLEYKGPTQIISEHKNAEQAASRLYWAIRRLDEMHLSFMVSTLVPHQGIGVAINNRLKKAAVKHGQPSSL